MLGIHACIQMSFKLTASDLESARLSEASFPPYKIQYHRTEVCQVEMVLLFIKNNLMVLMYRTYSLTSSRLIFSSTLGELENV